MSAICWGVVPAAGSGTRMAADRPKQYLKIDGTTLLEYSVGALLEHAAIRGVTVALHAQDTLAAELNMINDRRVERVTGAEQRAGSVLAALEGLSTRANNSDWVLVHDAARPCLGAEELDRLIATVLSADCGGLLAVPIVDTVKQMDDARHVNATLDRSKLWCAQTPQMFRLGELRDAISAALAAGAPITDEASAMELAGHSVQLVPGSPANLKVTVSADLPLAAWYLDRKGVS